MLKYLWGGSPATAIISNSRTAFNVEDIDEEDEKEEEEEEILGNNNDNDDAQCDDIEFDDRENNKNAVESETLRNNANKVTAKFIDNKRTMLQKTCLPVNETKHI